MIIDISKKTIDLKKLDKHIDLYCSSIEEGKVDYLIINDETGWVLRQNAECKDYEFNPYAGRLKFYKGMKIAYCEDLDFGEVEII